MSAARWGKTDMVLKLVKEGADIHMQNEVCFIRTTDTMYETPLSSENQVYTLICLSLQRIEILVLL